MKRKWWIAGNLFSQQIIDVCCLLLVSRSDSKGDKKRHSRKIDFSDKHVFTVDSAFSPFRSAPCLLRIATGIELEFGGKKSWISMKTYRVESETLNSDYTRSHSLAVCAFLTSTEIYSCIPISMHYCTFLFISFHFILTDAVICSISGFDLKRIRTHTHTHARIALHCSDVTQMFVQRIAGTRQ